MIIGITGTLGAGKGSVTEILKEKGFEHYSVRDFLTKELNKRGIPVNIDSFASIANDLRQKNSPSYIIEQLYSLAQKENKDCIIESLRTVGEIESLKSKGNFYLIAVDAPSQTRYSRIILRNSETDNLTYEEFIEKEKKQMSSLNPHEQNLKKCIEMADFIIQNNKDFEYLRKQVDLIYEKIKSFVPTEIKVEEKKYPQEINQTFQEHKRPSWDEYFMEIMNAVAKRATCDRGRSGCVISKNNHILVTGYVGSPKGIPHCDEIGHQMKKTIHEDGTISQHCVRTAHAEQNAICQAAKLGIPLDGATLYCRMTPCMVCAKMIINSGIKRVVCEKRYHLGEESENLFKQAGIDLETLNNEIEKYENI